MKNIKQKILYLSYDGMTDSLGQSQVLPYLFGLAKKGICIHLISFEKKEYAKDIPRIKELCEENGVIWHPQNYTKKPPLISTLKDIKRMKKVAMNLHSTIKFDIVHCRSYISAIVGRFFQKKEGLKFIFDMRGFWADERVEGGIWNLSNPVFKSAFRYFKSKELEFFSHADTIVSLTHNGKKEIESWGNLPHPLQIEVIPCCVDLERFDPKNIKSDTIATTRESLGITENDFVLGYLGSIGTWYMLPEMLDFYVLLRQQKEKSKFLFLTQEAKEDIHEIAKEKGIPKDEIIVISTKHNEVPRYISIFNLSIFFIRPTFSKKASSPTKQGELMAMGIPIICNAGIGDTDKIIMDSSAGKVIQVMNPESYESCSLNTEKYDKEKIRDGAKRWYSLEAGVEKYHEIYQRLLNS
ncbi:MAG TPA: glycosyltransferase [Brumimicrobium sp.]|nr:glycosyltransferase [Brumimicrobium sp.]